MLTDFLYEYISGDKDCLLGLIPDANKFAVLISPLNANTLYPVISSTETPYWIKKHSIILDNNVKISNKSFVSDNLNNDWSISTKLNLLGNVESTGNNFTFSTKFKIDTTNIGNKIIPLFKQGGTDVNDTLDIHFEFNRNTDSSGSLDKLVINVYYESPSDSVALNLQSFELTNIWTLVNTDVQLSIVIDSENSIIKVFSNDNLIGSKVMDLSKILGLPLNTPQNRSGNMNMIIGGSKFLEMKNVYIWKRALSLSEIQFLNKINSERIEKIENLPEDINSLTFTAVENSSLKMIQVGDPIVNGIQYRISLASSWRPYNIGDVIELPRGHKVQFKNTNEQLSTSSNDYVYFVMAGNIKASGNIQSMLNYSDSCTEWCYSHMFEGCSSLTEAPELLATTLASRCYYHMFDSTSLISAPELPATTLTNGCYQGMFWHCDSLIIAPELPATTLAYACYSQMFGGCNLLVTAPELPATILASNCYESMFNTCRSLTTAPELPATTLTNGCYQGMFDGCISLIEAPELPATTLVDRCYAGMFNGCTSISSISVKFNSWLENATTYWLNGVFEVGTFNKLGGLPEVRGPSAIPNNWSIFNFNTYKRDLDYIESTGTQYINTDIKPDFVNGDSIEIKFNAPNETISASIFGSIGENTLNGVYTNGSNVIVGENSAYQNIPFDYSGDHVLKINGTSIIDNDSQLALMPYSPTSLNNVFLFAFNNTGTVNGIFSGLKIYEWKYYKNGVLAQHLIPVMNNNDIPCMYDLVNGTFKYNAGTGQFNYGNLPYRYKLNYLESTGTQYIDTDVTNEDATIEITSYGIHSSGCRISYGNNENRITVGLNAVDSAFGSSVYPYDQTNIGSYKHVFKLANDGGFYIDDELKYQHQSSISNYLNIYIFAFNNNETATFTGNYTSRIYDVKISKNGVLTNHFIPVIDNNDVPAMYDELNGIFKYNAGTDQFNYNII